MAIAQRIGLYGELESLRARPLIVYVTSSRPGLSSMMASDAILELQDQLELLPKDAKKADILVVSNGGDPTVAWRAITLLRERVEEVAVLVPQAAYSAATLLALGANEIIMHPNGNLGPVDPQISVLSGSMATRRPSNSASRNLPDSWSSRRRRSVYPTNGTGWQFSSYSARRSEQCPWVLRRGRRCYRSRWVKSFSGLT